MITDFTSAQILLSVTEVPPDIGVIDLHPAKNKIAIIK